MSFMIVDGVIILDYSDIKCSDINIATISDHTANTWQADRSAAERMRDTGLGKLAEDAFAAAIESLGIENFHSYDEFRADHFHLHAPFDGLFCDHLSQELIDLINRSVNTVGSRLTPEIREAIRSFGARTVEVKSTRLNDRYRDKASFSSYSDHAQLVSLITHLKGLDFLTYPHYIRTGDYTYTAYCNYVNETFLHLDVPQAQLSGIIREIEISHAADVYVRVFMDEQCGKALILGWIDKETFFTPPELRKLVQRGKSENALYFVKEIRKGSPLELLKNAL